MVAYIARADDPEIPPPYDFPGITIQSFRLPASLPKLQKLCDEMLNIGSLEDRGFEYRAFTDFVDMEFVTYPKMVFDQKPYSKRGYAQQQELYFRFYVWRFVSFFGLLFPMPLPELCFPFIFVDNSWSMISGRDVIGFPKVMAEFSFTPALNAQNLQITASALALKKYKPTTKLDWQPIVTVSSSGAPAGTLDGVWPWIGLGANIADPFLNPLLQDALANLPDVFSTVHLKQFRDAESSTEACYQAVVTAPFTPSNISVPKPLPPVTITVDKYASLDIAGSLGFPAGVPLTPSLQYSVTLDMRMSGLTNLFVNS